MSTKQVVLTPLAPQPIGTYSQAIKDGNTVYLSGQIGKNESTGQLVLEPFEAQAKQVFQNLKTVAEASGGGLDDILKLTIFITDFKNFPTVNKVMEGYFRPPFPARSTVAVAALPLGVDIEVEGILRLPQNTSSKI